VVQHSVIPETEKAEEIQLLQAMFYSQVNLCTFSSLQTALLNLSRRLQYSLTSFSNTLSFNSVRSVESVKELRPKTWLAHTAVV